MTCCKIQIQIQAADCICMMELTALKYADKSSTATDEKLFGFWLQFRRGTLKEVRSKGH